MRKDLDSLMQANGLDAILVTGPCMGNPFMAYFTGVVHVTHADLLKKRGAAPILFHPSMEREEAARTGLETRSYLAYPWQEILKGAGMDVYKASAERYRRMLADAGFTSGRLALYGQADMGMSVNVMLELQRLLPGVEFAGYQQKDVLLTAMATKEQDEVERIRRMGKVTAGVVGRVREFLSSQVAKDNVLVHDDGSPVTIGEVKGLINRWLSEQGVDNPEGTIFAIGHDAGVPHSTGTASDVLRLGVPIVFDIYPCEAGGGYYYDMTRTWCLGYAPEKVQRLYDHVHQAYTQVRSSLKPDALFSDYQRLTCEIFEEQGHPTVLSDYATEVGYVHSLGHGVGLHIHERPSSSLDGSNQDTLAAGSVFTIEPGLYYPEQEMGMRLEDTLWARPDGTFEVLADFPLDLVVPVRGQKA